MKPRNHAEEIEAARAWEAARARNGDRKADSVMSDGLVLMWSDEKNDFVLRRLEVFQDIREPETSGRIREFLWNVACVMAIAGVVVMWLFVAYGFDQSRMLP